MDKITIEEIPTAINSLINNKAEETDKITSKLLKYRGQKLVQFLTSLLSQGGHFEEVPENCQIGIISNYLKREILLTTTTVL